MTAGEQSSISSPLTEEIGIEEEKCNVIVSEMISDYSAKEAIEKWIWNLDPENDSSGNVEYKLKLVSPSSERLQHLITQMKWRIGVIKIHTINGTFAGREW